MIDAISILPELGARIAGVEKHNELINEAQLERPWALWKEAANRST